MMNTDDIDDEDAHYLLLFMLFIIHVYLIMCLWAYDKLIATPLLKLWQLKANHS